MIVNLAWVLPRPRKKDKYLGGFPLHFERRLLELLNINPHRDKILQPFGGKAEYGIRMDINPEVKPDIVGDAHNLPFKDNVFDLVLLDPPYSSDEAMRLYGTDHPKFKLYITEAVRVLRESGFLVMYHDVATPAIRDTRLVKRIFIESRMWHKLRCVHIHRKDTLSWRGHKGQSVMDLEV